MPVIAPPPYVMTAARGFMHVNSLIVHDPKEGIPVTWLSDLGIAPAPFAAGARVSKHVAHDFVRKQIEWKERLANAVDRAYLGDVSAATLQRGSAVLQHVFATPHLGSCLREIGIDILPEGALTLTLYLPHGRLHLNTYVNLEDDPDDTVLDFYATASTGRVSWQWEGPATALGQALQRVPLV
jgi:hypothetical protein